MILEIVLCDSPSCRNQVDMRGSAVPLSWISSDGRQFCSPCCFDSFTEGEL